MKPFVGVANAAYAREDVVQRVASDFRNKRCQAVRIPKEFELPGDEVTIARLADGSLIIRSRLRLEALLRTLEPLDPSDALGDSADLEANDVTLLAATRVSSSIPISCPV